MKRSFGLAIGLVFATGLALSATGFIKIKSAQVSNNVAAVSGKAAPNAPISWEGSVVTTSDRRGNFSFNGAVPADCSGTLSDGRSSITVIVSPDPYRYRRIRRSALDCRPAAPVPQTGQTVSYVDDDDGDLQNGVAMPTPRFTDNANGTIYDNLSGLTWLKNANCPQTVEYRNEALFDIVTLNATGMMRGHDCGDTSKSSSHQTDWRLPNIKELQSLIHYGFAFPAISNLAGTDKGSASEPFSNFPANSGGPGVWSSTTFAGNPAIAWGVAFDIGGVNYGDLTAVGQVMAVRGGLVN